MEQVVLEAQDPNVLGLMQANLDCQEVAESLLRHVDQLLQENRDELHKLDSCITVNGILVEPSGCELNASDYAAPYFKHRREDSADNDNDFKQRRDDSADSDKDKWHALADNDDALLLKRMGITSLSFLHGHRAFLRIERKKLSLAVVKACISIKLNELYGAQNQCAEGSDESKRVRNETDRYTDLKNQFKGEDEDGDEDGDDEEEEDEERELGRLNGVLDGASGGGGTAGPRGRGWRGRIRPRVGRCVGGVGGVTAPRVHLV